MIREVYDNFCRELDNFYEFLSLDWMDFSHVMLLFFGIIIVILPLFLLQILTTLRELFGARYIPHIIVLTYVFFFVLITTFIILFQLHTDLYM